MKHQRLADRLREIIKDAQATPEKETKHNDADSFHTEYTSQNMHMSLTFQLRVTPQCVSFCCGCSSALNYAGSSVQM